MVVEAADYRGEERRPETGKGLPGTRDYGGDREDDTEFVRTLVVLAASHEEFRLPPPNPHISVESLPEGTLIVATLQDRGPEGTVKL